MIIFKTSIIWTIKDPQVVFTELRRKPRPEEAVAKAPVAILAVVAFVTPERLIDAYHSSSIWPERAV